MTDTTKMASYLDRVHALTPLVREQAAEIEAGRTITKTVADAITEAGLHGMLIPEALGGGGLLPSEGMRVFEEMTKADASVGWAWMASEWGTAGVVGYLQPETLQEMMSGDEPFIVAGQLLPRHPGTQVEGGFIIDGDYSFASGSDHATWIGAGFFVADDSGAPILGENGQIQLRIALMPKAQVDLKGNWEVWGLAGTGSHDYRVDKVFVPFEHTTPTFGGTATRPEPMYKFGNEFAGGLPHAPIALGIAARALELIAELTTGKMRPNYTVPVGEADFFRIDFARKEADLQAARLYAYSVVEQAEAAVAAGEPITAEMVARASQMLAWSHEVASGIVAFAHRWGGSKSIGSTSELGRYSRDMQVATQHLLVDPKMLVDAAAVLLTTYAEAARA